MKIFFRSIKYKFYLITAGPGHESGRVLVTAKMAKELTIQDRLKAHLDELFVICESPESYLPRLYTSLRNEVIETKRLMYQGNREINESLNNIQKQIDNEIESFGNECSGKTLDVKATKEKLNAIQVSDFQKLKETIEKEERLMLNEFFHDKTIAFVSVKHLSTEPGIKQLIDRKLVILNDVFIRPKAIQQM